MRTEKKKVLLKKKRVVQCENKIHLAITQLVKSKN